MLKIKETKTRVLIIKILIRDIIAAKIGFIENTK
jgi:hypothetical protein